ncbi:hypothetical protein GALL_406230 [mine drainage metagenome]|uniref:Uncharacterized protein n=1 Tax=mine drainage metagenome TaxID=410659 RepID=A0A1J5Q1W5_9ZZZZ
MAVDHAAYDRLAGQARDWTGRQRAADGVQGDALDVRRGEHRERIAEAPVRGSDEDRRARGAHQVGGERGVRLRERAQHPGHRDVDRVGHQGGLVELHPGRPGRRERLEQLGVHGKQVREPVDRREALRGALGGLRERQEGHRPHDHRAGQDAVGQGLRELAHRAVVGEPEDGVRADLGDQVVVVRVEPLGHLGREVVTRAARDGRVPREVQSAVRVGQPGETCRDRADDRRGVEHVVVERERGRDRGDVRAQTEGGEARARPTAQVGRSLLDVGRGRLAGPERLDGLLELAPGPDARVPQNGAGPEVGNGGGDVGHVSPSKE